MSTQDNPAGGETIARGKWGCKWKWNRQIPCGLRAAGDRLLMFHVSMKTIPLTQGKVALVDDEDFERLSKYKWQALRVRQKRGDVWYARRMTSLKDGPRRAVYMHAEVMGFPDAIVNHKDFDGLNNQKGNLEECSYEQNNRYRRKTVGTWSRYKGVTMNRGRWMAGIKFHDKSITLGYFEDEEDAARAYNVAAAILFGAHAFLNDV